MVQDAKAEGQGELSPPRAHQCEEAQPHAKNGLADALRLPGPVRRTPCGGGSLLGGRAVLVPLCLRQRGEEQVLGWGFLLLGHEACVDAPGGHQRLVRALFGQTSIVEDEDAVRVDDAGEPVGNDQRGAALHQAVHCLSDDGLVAGVNARERLVEDEDGSVLEQRPGDGDALALPAGEPDASLAHDGVVAVGEGEDELVSVGRLGGVLHLLGRDVGVAHPQVVCDSPVEQVGVLGDDRYVRAQKLQREVPEVVAAQGDAALLGVEETQEEPHHGGLAGPAVPDKSQGFACSEREAQLAQRRPSTALVAEVDALDPDLGSERSGNGAVALGGLGEDGGGALGVRLVHLDLGVHESEDALGGGNGVHALVVELDQLSERPENLCAEQQHDDQRPDVHGAVADAQDAEAQGRGRRRR